MAAGAGGVGTVVSLALLLYAGFPGGSYRWWSMLAGVGVGLAALVLLIGYRSRRLEAEVALPPGVSIRRSARTRPRSTAATIPANAAGPATALVGHRGAVRAVGFSADGRVLATGGQDGTLAVWDFTGPGEPSRLAAVTAAAEEVHALAFAPRGRLLATASGVLPSHGAGAILWDLTEPTRPVRAAELTAALPGAARQSGLHTVAFRPDGRLLAAAGRGGVTALWDLRDPAGPVSTGTITHRDRIRTVGFSADGRRDSKIEGTKIDHPTLGTVVR